MAAAKPEAVTARLRHVLHSVCYKPNSITPAGSELVRSWFEAGSYQIPLHQLVRSWLRTTGSELAPNQLRTSQRNGIWLYQHGAVEPDSVTKFR